MISYPISSPYLVNTKLEILGITIPVQIAWYGVLFALGILLSCCYCQRKINNTTWINKEQFDQLALKAMLGAVIGGKLGYTILYTGLFQPEQFINSLFSRQGMSFHGGLLGCILSMYIFSQQHKLSFITVTDWIAPSIPWALMLGRVGNFINAELWGRASDLPWAIIFPNAGGIPRHPSQIYEMLLEGILLGIICHYISKRYTKAGINSGVFLIGYGCFRIIAEFFREPDGFIGLLFGINLSFGQILCLPMIILGLTLIKKATAYQVAPEST